MKSLLILAAMAAAPAIAAAPATTASPTAAQSAPGAGQAPPAAIAPTPAPTPAQVASGAAVPDQPSGSAATDAAAATAAPAPAIPMSQPVPGIGMPDGRMGLQDQFTEIGADAAWMHDVILMPIITAISIFVLALLVYAIIRYRRSANPTPSTTTHNTFIEVVWTLVPVLLLLVIAVPSIRLLAKQYAPPAADLTVKVVGNQWYWTYQYPDNGDFEIVSNMLKEPGDAPAGTRTRTDADGPRLLAVDERMVVPAGAVVKLIVTSADVIHSFAVPAFWSKMDAVPGKLNETWFKVDRPGVYYGQCSELCGARHAFMPIAVEVVPPARFAAWVASKGGTMPVPSGAEGPGAAGAASPDATSPASPATAPTESGGSPQALGTEGADGDATVNATAPATPSPQGATANQGTQTR